jgi:hypothetical protein
MAQEFKTDVSYKYMFANQWDKAIQTYNFSRPFISEKQPLLMHGLNASISYIFKSTKNLRHGINLSYSYFRSSSENENLENVLNLHSLNLGYILHYENNDMLKGLYTDLIISATSSGLFRKVNGEAFEYDDTKSKAFGIGGDIALKLGYCVKLKNKNYLSPFIALGYTPYLYSPNTEALINQTKGLLGKNWTGILTTQIGLTFHIRKQIND